MIDFQGRGVVIAEDLGVVIAVMGEEEEEAVVETQLDRRFASRDGI